MKIKKLTKKLSLNKNTIAHLEDMEMKKLQGGIGEIILSALPTNSCLSTIYCC